MTQIRNDEEFKAVLHGLMARWRRSVEATTPRHVDRPHSTIEEYGRWYRRQCLIWRVRSCIRRVKALLHAVTRSGGKKADRVTPRGPLTLFMEVDHGGKVAWTSERPAGGLSGPVGVAADAAVCRNRGV